MTLGCICVLRLGRGAGQHRRTPARLPHLPHGSQEKCAAVSGTLPLPGGAFCPPSSREQVRVKAAAVPRHRLRFTAVEKKTRNKEQINKFYPSAFQASLLPFVK